MLDLVDARLRRQYGIISRTQALGAGMTRGQIDQRLRTGRWERLHPGVYRVASSTPTWRGRVLAATLAADGVASHRSALALHGLGRRGVVDITVPKGRWRHLDGVEVRQSTQCGSLDVVDCFGISTTSVSRTLVDVGCDIGDRRLTDVIDAALRDRRVGLEDLITVLRRHSEHGRNGCGPLRRQIEWRIDQRRVPMSAWSRSVERLLVEHGLPKPELEWPIIGEQGVVIASADLAYPEHRLVIELDSVRWHLNRTSFQSDRTRTNQLVTLGWTVLAFTWEDFVDRPHELVRRVAALLARRPDSDRRPIP